MCAYRPDMTDPLFILNEVLETEMGRDDLSSFLDSAAKLAGDVWAPLNAKGDEIGAKRDQDGNVTMPEGFKDAYDRYCAIGLNGASAPEEYGGMGLPASLVFAFDEMFHGANMSLGLCPMLTQSAIEALVAHGSEEQKTAYLEKLVSGEWAGTMLLTEPGAGSDVGALTTKAVKRDDGTYALSGTKIFITFGNHDMTENIIHFVLARVEGAPAGTKGISMFIVPKILEDGSANDVHCAKLEEKEGIHASPTCEMVFGNKDKTVAYLVDEENQGMKCMFTMMNRARLGVGVQGLGISAAALQAAEEYAKIRKQSGKLIGEFAGVRRKLMDMRAMVDSGRVLAYYAGSLLDKAHKGDKDAQSDVDILTPVVKALCTYQGREVAQTCIDVHGGMGVIRETGVEQFKRDVDVAAIYEGTNLIQAKHLMFRLLLDKNNPGAAMKACIGRFREMSRGMMDGYFDALEDMAEKVVQLAIKNKDSLESEEVKEAEEKAALEAMEFACEDFLNAFGLIAGGALMIKSATVAKISPNLTPDFQSRKLETASHFMRFILPRVNTNLAALKHALEPDPGFFSEPVMQPAAHTGTNASPTLGPCT